MTDEEIKAAVTGAARIAAQETLHQTFRMFGVDTENQDSVNEFRSDLVFAREMRKTTKGVKSRIFMVVVGVITLGAFTAMIKGFGFSPE